MTGARTRAAATASAAIAVLVMVGTPRAQAHEGPPLPVFVDRPVGGYRLSFWADPDLGEGTLYLKVDAGGPGDEAAVVVFEVDDGSGGPVRYPARREAGGAYVADVPFARKGACRVSILVEGARGPVVENAEVMVGEPGLGAWDLLIYGAPFLMLGVLAAIVVIRKRAAAGRC